MLSIKPLFALFSHAGLAINFAELYDKKLKYARGII